MNDLFRFKGKTTDEGYTNGEIYMLELFGRGAYMDVRIDAPIAIPYRTWTAFFEEWERV